MKTNLNDVKKTILFCNRSNFLKQLVLSKFPNTSLTLSGNISQKPTQTVYSSTSIFRFGNFYQMNVTCVHSINMLR